MAGRELPSFTCPCCGAESFNPNDVAQSYCGRCHWWTGDPVLGPPHLANHCPVRPFKPDWTLHPGVILRQELVARDIAPDALAASAGMAAEVIAEVIGGTRKIDQIIAERLYAALGISASFWLNFQARYDADIARGAKDASGEGHP